jgi:hypothetical protein
VVEGAVANPIIEFDASYFMKIDQYMRASLALNPHSPQCKIAPYITSLVRGYTETVNKTYKNVYPLIKLDPISASKSVKGLIML